MRVGEGRGGLVGLREGARDGARVGEGLGDGPGAARRTHSPFEQTLFNALLQKAPLGMSKPDIWKFLSVLLQAPPSNRTCSLQAFSGGALHPCKLL
jgi:hypothetical protein